MKALLIEFNLENGKRAGDIDPKDPNLQCYGWQDLDSTPAKEIRVIEDDRDISQYEGIDGVKILHNRKKIDKAIDQNVPTPVSINDEILFKTDIDQRGIKLENMSGARQKILRKLKDRGMKCLAEREPPHMDDIYPK